MPFTRGSVTLQNATNDNSNPKDIVVTSETVDISVPSTNISRDGFHEKHYKVVIVGAGASGIQCCNTLMKQYHIPLQDILILEARSRIGGRIYTTIETANVVVMPEKDPSSEDTISITETTTTKFALDHGAAWVHGTGFEIGTTLPAMIPEELLLEDEDTHEKAINVINPMMYLLEQQAVAVSQHITSNDTRTSEIKEGDNSEYERRFYINPIVSGNPWMRPRSVLHGDGQLGLYVAGQYLFGNTSSSNSNSHDTATTLQQNFNDIDNNNNNVSSVQLLLRRALQRHYSILRQIQTIGNDMYDTGRGIETTTTSLADTIQMALSQLLLEEESPEDDVDFTPSMGSHEEKKQRMIAAIAPFYMLLLECWYGCEVGGMQLSEFIEDEDRILDYEDHTYQRAGDFVGPHCTLQNGMISVLQPLLQNGVKEQILCSEEVIKIQYGYESDNPTAINNDITNHTDAISIETSSGLHITTDTCVVTMPAGCLKHAVFNETVFVGAPFSPEKMECISLLEMGTYKKIFLTFDRIFWPTQPAFLGLIRHMDSIENTNDGGDDDIKKEMYYKLKSVHPLGNCILVDNLWARRNIAAMEIVLFGLAGRWSTGKSENEIRDAILEFISDAMNISMSQIQEYYISCHITRWEEDRYSRGAYSSTALGTLPRHIEEFRRPEWDDRLVFSGEATISEYDGSVFAALYSGMNAAKCVHDYFSNKDRKIIEHNA